MFTLQHFAQADQPSIHAGGQSTQSLIEGVRLCESRQVLTANGSLCELFRGQWCQGAVDHVFMRTLVAGMASGWHVHAKTTDRLTVISGVLDVALFDDRAESISYQRVNRFILGAARPMLLIIPPGIWHAIRAHAAQDAVLMNITDLAYDYGAPDHFRLPLDTDLIPTRI